MEKEKFYSLLDDPGNLNNETLEELRIVTNENPAFQAGWMLFLKNLKMTNNPEYEATLQKVAVSVPDRKQLHRFLFPEKSEKKDKIRTTRVYNAEYDLGESEMNESGDPLIDKFLSDQPGSIRMENNKAEPEPDYLEDEVEENTLNDDEELITETLAMIYFEQKKYDKALNAFRKLSLKYPEKSIYFATRIEEIEKLKNI